MPEVNISPNTALLSFKILSIPMSISSPYVKFKELSRGTSPSCITQSSEFTNSLPAFDNSNVLKFERSSFLF